jgi:hypothetical protein
LQNAGPKNATKHNPPPHGQRQPSNQTNGVAQASQASESELLSPRVNALRNKTSDLSNAASEPDSLIDLYKPTPMTRTASYGTSATKPGRKSYAQNGTAQKATPEDDESNWIHRDKLAQIESRELEEAGFRVTRRPSERFDGATKREEKRQRLASPARIDGEDEDVATQDYSMADDGMTTPPKSFIPKPASSRSGGSRIPIPKGVSVSGSHGDRDQSATGTRSRTGSEAWNYSADGSPQSQASGGAGEEEIILANSPPDTPPRSAVNTSQSSPQKSKSTKNGTTGRKAGAGAVRGTGKPTPSRTASSNTGSSSVAGGTADGSINKRPGTSSGPRPSTSHRPEGEPPWLATMYAPDPRLPPEQQMLPTHAKRLAQEQWEKEGRTGTVYDREFRLLNSEPFPENSKRYSSAAASEAEAVGMSPPAADDRSHRASLQSRATSGAVGARGSGVSDIRTTTLQSPGQHNTWSTSPPLGSPASLRPGTGGTLDHGGYRTMPALAKSPTPNGDAVAAGSRGDHQASPAPPPIRIKNFDDDEVGKQKGGCCQCVIM